MSSKWNTLIKYKKMVRKAQKFPSIKRESIIREVKDGKFIFTFFF